MKYQQTKYKKSNVTDDIRLFVIKETLFIRQIYFMATSKYYSNTICRSKS